jgi:hypothetical protein
VALILSLAMIAGIAPCDAARAHYQALSLEAALTAAEAELQANRDRPLECLEVAALALIVEGRHEDAKARFTELFEREPDRVIEDPALPPAVRANIERIREDVRPMSARSSVRWLVHESLRLDVVLSGGLRDATSVRYTTRLGAAGPEMKAELPLVGRVATGTIAVGPDVDSRLLALSGQVIGRSGRVLHQFSSEMLLVGRPAAKTAVVVEDGIPWWTWVVVGGIAIGSAAAVLVIAQPSAPDPERGALGRGSVDP